MKKTNQKQMTNFVLLTLLVSFALGLALGSTSAVTEVTEVCAGKNQADCNAAFPPCMWNGTICLEGGDQCHVPCENITNSSVCTDVEVCFWNGTSCLDNCSALTSNETCNQNNACLWDIEFSECVNKFPVCPNITTQNLCQQVPDCTWNASATPPCQPICAPPTETTTTTAPLTTSTVPTTTTSTVPTTTTQPPANCPSLTEAVCMQTPGCWWDGGQQQCKYQMTGFDCHPYNTEETCMAHANDNCWWDDHGGEGPGECFFLDPNQPHCFMYDDNQTGCENQSGCEWVTEVVNATLNDTWCGPEGMGYCSQFNESACVQDPKCMWIFENWWEGEIEHNKTFCGVDMGGGMDPDCQLNCTKCRDPGMCSGSPKGCYYNFTANNSGCFEGNITVNSCEGIPNPQCDNTFGCMWDAFVPDQEGNGTHGECVRDNRVNVTGCPSYPTNESCSRDNNCAWLLDGRDNIYKCMRKAGEACAGKIHIDCVDDPNCDWDYGTETCNPAWGGGVCEGMFEPEACKRTAGCKWDSFQWRCVAGSVVNCSTQNTSAFCTMYGECTWNGTACRLSQCASNCSACNQSNACMTSPRDCWWDFGMNQCRQHEQPTCANGMCDMCETIEDCYNTTLHPMNPFCGWFENPQQAPGYIPPPSQSISKVLGVSTAGPGPSNCQMNTTCAQDCFMCQTEAECRASNDSAFKNQQDACDWDPLSSWNPCFPKALDCSTIDNQPQCDPNPDCNWNGQTQQCENVGFSGGGPCDTNCTFCGDEWGCKQSPMGCGWNPSASPPCSQSNCFSLGCSNCYDKDNCMKADGKYRGQGAAGCQWWDYNNGTKTCRDRSCETDCTLCLTQTGCANSGVGCEWTSSPSGSIGILQTGTCDFKVGGAAACHVKCEACQSDGDCWNSYSGCQWDYSIGRIIPVVIQNDAFNATTLTINPGDGVVFRNSDQGNHTVTAEPQSFYLPLQPNEEYLREFYDVLNYTVYLEDVNGTNLTIYVVARLKNESACRPNNCKQDCSQCHDPPSCEQSFAGCFWDMGMGMCQGKGYGMTCAQDCWFCDNQVKCNASNATMWTSQGQVSGCQWVFDYMDGTNACRPAGMEFTCDAMCEQCNETQCATAHPTELPPEASGCKWFANEWTPRGATGACHPDGFGGMGSGCAHWDFTSKAECESQAGCKWFSVDRICDPDLSQMTCNERCDLCNQTQCNDRSPKCIWDTPPFGNPFCREDWGGGGFKFGGNCNGNCFDCFDNQSCTNSPNGCRWVEDPFSPMGYHCDPSDMPICEEECFSCFTPGSCATSTNTRMVNKSTEECTGLLQTPCEGNGFCNWTGSACVSIVPGSCEWDNQFMFCKPTGLQMEICFMPGDEDNDGKENCKDEECSMDPMCMFGATGGGPMGMNIDCWIWDEMNGGNQSVCECNESTLAENGSCMDGGQVANATGCVWHTVPKPYPQNGTEGLCDPKFNDQVFKGMGEDMPFMILHDPCFDNEQPWINVERDVLQNKSWLDICDIGIREMENTTAFILNLKSVRNLSLCNFLNQQDNTNESGKYYFLLDTDNNVSSGCNIDVNITEMDRTPSNFQFGENGFEYRLDYIVNYSNGTITETRTVYKCINGSWGVASAQVSGKKDKACEHESIYYGIRKADIGNPSGTIHIVAFTAEITGGFGSPLVAMDRAYHAYYTPNTIDMNPPDCATNPAACGSGYDPNLGVMLFEDCMPGTGDEDKDGKINCNDEECFQSVFCAGNSTYNASADKQAPSITSRSVQVEQTMAIMLWTTSEPATGVVQFYGTNSTCEASVQNISQYNDPFFTMDDYLPAHMVPLDANYPDAAYALASALQPNTTYYYKLRSCDQAQVFNNATNSTNPNCAVTKCLNFTTKRSCEAITNETVCLQTGVCAWNASLTPSCFKQVEFGFEFTTNSSDPTDFLGGAGFQMDLGGQTTNISAGTKVKTNESGCNMTLRFSNEMTMLYGQRAPWTIEMRKCCVPKQTINLTDALQVANASNQSLFVGLTSGVWQQIAQKLGCKQVFLHLPGFFQDCSSLSIQHCDENGANCVNVTLDNATMTFCNSSVSIWELAGSDTSLFSSYTNEYGIDSTAPRVTGYDAPSTIRGDYAVVTVTSNENSNVTVHYAPCNMTLYNDTGEGDCITSILHALVKSTDYANWSNIVPDGQTRYNTTMAKAHAVYLTNLTEQTKYFYMVLAMDASMNQRTLNDMEYYYRFTSTTAAQESQSSLVTGWNLISLPVSL